LFAAWKTALSMPVDAFIWLNDDVELLPDALEQTLACWMEASRRNSDGKFILTGATIGDKGEFTHGGKRWIRTPWALRFQDIAPTEQLEAIDTFNGNYVVVPRAVTDSIGLNDPAFFHNMGDIDYGLRASRAGMAVWLMPAAIGICPFNSDKANSGFGNRNLSLFQQWRKVNTPHGAAFRSWARLTFRHSGVWFPLHFLLAYRRLVIPRWVLNLFGPKSTANES
jgi:GT2 family glycosyltransferase